MKVILLNGSSHTDGCTARAIREVEDTLKFEGIETEVINIKNNSIRGCIACRTCSENGKCIFDDIVNEIAVKFEKADGIVVGTPVYYAGINGSLKSLLDRLFFSSRFEKTMKVGAAVVSSRRAGSTIVSSTYWNEVHGQTAEEVEQDAEGLKTMRTLGRNMAFLIKSINLGIDKYGIPR